jgi:hypothetical protein
MLNQILTKIQKKEPFALLRFGDGEYCILRDIHCIRNGFSYNPYDMKDKIFRENLINSLQYNGGKNYFVGICNKKVKKGYPHKWLKEKVSPNSTIINASIFVNNNYLEFLDKFIPEFKKHDIIFVGNIKADTTKLPFKVHDFMPITNSVWRDYSNFIYESLIYWLFNEKKCYIVLVAGGVYSCVLIHKLWKANPNHIYIDIGSVFDPYIYGKNTRKYHNRKFRNE